MDPDKTLTEIRALIATVEPVASMSVMLATPEGGIAEVDYSDDVARLCEHVRELDGWLARGGFLPASWKR